MARFFHIFVEEIVKRVLSIAFSLMFVVTLLMADNGGKLGQNYPNPSNGKTYVDVEFSSTEATLTLSTILGETISIQKLPHSGTYIIDVTNIPEGFYFYTLDADGEKTTKRLTVKK